MLPQIFDSLLPNVFGGDKVIAVIFKPQDIGIFRLAGALRDLGYRVEYWLDVGRRARDDAEHFGDRSLVLERFLKILGPRLHLVE